jgi:hypothetical protein
MSASSTNCHGCFTYVCRAFKLSLFRKRGTTSVAYCYIVYTLITKMFPARWRRRIYITSLSAFLVVGENGHRYFRKVLHQGRAQLNRGEERTIFFCAVLCQFDQHCGSFGYAMSSKYCTRFAFTRDRMNFTRLFRETMKTVYCKVRVLYSHS